MRIPFSWIQSWTNTELEIKDFVKNLHNIGFEVDEIIDRYINIPLSIVVGEIKSILDHPNADKLKIAEVDIGNGYTIKLVCGAHNCVEGIKVACALEGTIIPINNSKIIPIKIRGIQSNGMLCSKKELCLPTKVEDTGIMELPDDFKIGKPLSEYLICKDSILTIPVLPNRPDCLSVRGLSREILSSIEKKPLKNNFPIYNNSRNNLDLEIIHSKDTVEEYYLAYIDGICLSKPLHPIIDQRLYDSSLKIQNNIVSLLNYLTLELGQPMHAFDADKIVGKLYTRYSYVGECIELLNGNKIVFDNNKTILISDEEGPLCIAGIMGGTRAMITNETKKIYLECALFPYEKIAATVQEYNLLTQSSNLFAKRSVDKDICKTTLFYTIEKIKKYFGLINFRTFLYSYKSEKEINIEPRKEIIFPLELLKETIGCDINNTDLKNFITIMKISGAYIEEVYNENKKVIEIKIIPPSWRKDILLAEDIVEWYLRVKGYNNIESKPLYTKIWEDKIKNKPYESVEWELENKITNYLVNSGFYEVKTFSFTSSELQNKLIHDKSDIEVKIPYPISNNLNALQYSLISNLLLVANYNQSRHANKLKLFEIANIFEYNKNIEEYQSFGLLLSLGNDDNIYPNIHTSNIYERIYFELKNVLEKLLFKLGIDANKIEFKQGINGNTWATNAQSSHFESDSISGVIGILNKNIEKFINIKYPVAIAEIKILKKCTTNRINKHIKIPSYYPTTRRSFTFSIKNMYYSEFIQIANNSLSTFKDLLINIYFSDIYREKLAKTKETVKITITLEIQGIRRNISSLEIENFISQWLYIIAKTSNILIDKN